MSFTVSLGVWLVPLAITLVSFAWAIPMRENERPGGGIMSGFGYAIGALLRCLFAACCSLFAWLIWALST